MRAEGTSAMLLCPCFSRCTKLCNQKSERAPFRQSGARLRSTQNLRLPPTSVLATSVSSLTWRVSTSTR